MYGFKDSYLKYDYSENQWVVKMYNNPYVFAINNETDNKSMLPFGTHDWYIFNDTCNYDGNSLMRKTKLSLSRCAEDEFTCQNDGTW